MLLEQDGTVRLCVFYDRQGSTVGIYDVNNQKFLPDGVNPFTQEAGIFALGADVAILTEGYALPLKYMKIRDVSSPPLPHISPPDSFTRRHLDYRRTQDKVAD